MKLEVMKIFSEIYILKKDIKSKRLSKYPSITQNESGQKVRYYGLNGIYDRIEREFRGFEKAISTAIDNEKTNIKNINEGKR